MSNMSNAFYGGGHAMKSASDFVYWCLRNTSVFYGPKDVFTPPKAVPGVYVSHQRIITCANLAGVEMDARYADLLGRSITMNKIITPTQAIRTRGALLLNQGTVCVSVGDGRRVIYEQDYTLIMKFINHDGDLNHVFEYGALLSELEYQ